MNHDENFYVTKSKADQAILLEHFKNLNNPLHHKPKLSLINKNYVEFSQIITDNNFQLKDISASFNYFVKSTYYTYNKKNIDIAKEIATHINENNSIINLWNNTYDFYNFKDQTNLDINSNLNFHQTVSSCLFKYFENHYAISQHTESPFLNLLLDKLPPININNNIFNSFFKNISNIPNDTILINDFNSLFNQYKKHKHHKSFLVKSIEHIGKHHSFLFSSHTDSSITFFLHEKYSSLDPQNPYKFLQTFLKNSVPLLQVIIDSELEQTEYFNKRIAPVIDFLLQCDSNLAKINHLGHPLAYSYLKSKSLLMEIEPHLAIAEDIKLSKKFKI